MRLDELTVRDFRCFETLQLEFDADLTWIVGPNASGKTSLLEALFFLGHGRSFRTARTDRLIRQEAGGFELVARLGNDGRRKVLGVARRDGTTEARFAGEPLRSMAEAAKLLPVVILDSEMNTLVSGGPGERRRWLDWGVFHVEPRFLGLWREYQQALRQRNMALKQGLPERALEPWTKRLVEAGEALANLREGYFRAVESIATSYARTAVPEIEVSAQYRKGWAEDETLAENLARHLVKDREYGNTRSGPHRADVQLKIDGLPAEERLSRGQQKMLAGALWLAQVRRYQDVLQQSPLLLVDDLAAELDSQRLGRFLDLLGRQETQKVLTAIGDDEVAATGLTGGAVFHVEP